MTDRVEHLIERAAAKLREAGAVPGAPLPADGVRSLGPAPAPLAFQPLPVPLPGPPRAEPPAADAGAGESLHASLPDLDVTIPRPPQPPASAAFASPPSAYPLPADDDDTLPEAVSGPIPAPAPPLRRTSPASARPALVPPPGPALGSLGFGTPPGPVARPGSTALQPPPVVQLDALERAGMVVARTTRTRISEEYRIAIGRILRVLHETADVQGARNVLMVTSARPGEGKSFSALNLAGSIAQNGTDAVLLVDVDPKIKPLSDQLGLGEAPGFLDLVSDPSLRPEDLLRVTAIPNLAVMPVGTRLGGAAQTAGGTASMRPIIPTVTRLARRFPRHLIMLDAPPCLSTSDPHTLAPHVGQVVLVVEAERTQRSEVEAAIDLVRVCPSITLLLNKVRMTTSHTFGAYDYFGSYT